MRCLSVRAGKSSAADAGGAGDSSGGSSSTGRGKKSLSGVSPRAGSGSKTVRKAAHFRKHMQPTKVGCVGTTQASCSVHLICDGDCRAKQRTRPICLDLVRNAAAVEKVATAMTERCRKRTQIVWQPWR